MIPTLVEQYRRWFDYEKDSHRKVLASLESVPEGGRHSEPFQKAMNIMGHMVAARQMWLYRFGFPVERPANLFPTDTTYEGLVADLESVERHWSDYFARLDEPELERTFDYLTSEGTRFRSVVADVLTQLYGHSLYHRGQIASLVRAAGGEPAKTDFIFWTRESISPTAS
ncbi:MAG: DinB family protein [Isosphaeraceae bacterium]